eukprot:CAMPEP_0194265586 /NCGR_PEP_ID=MMETSP0169-20130528/779_1 /TAXON_ID=218684 /ORGANISM="Corethron pennatum, Strain L29A3" /LENGTH=302 /DNA_ID=CAMNT_0039006081 /DNA_START=99 /DNA_END=1007 /DNA_ORIENTATION=+
MRRIIRNPSPSKKTSNSTKNGSNSSRRTKGSSSMKAPRAVESRADSIRSSLLKRTKSPPRERVRNPDYDRDTHSERQASTASIDGSEVFSTRSQPIFPFSKMFPEDEEAPLEKQDLSPDDIPNMSLEIRSKLEQAKRREEIILATLRAKMREERMYPSKKTAANDIITEDFIQKAVTGEIYNEPKQPTGSARNIRDSISISFEDIRQDTSPKKFDDYSHDHTNPDYYHNNGDNSDSDSEGDIGGSSVSNLQDVSSYQGDANSLKLDKPYSMNPISSMALSLGAGVEKVIEDGIRSVNSIEFL